MGKTKHTQSILHRVRNTGDVDNGTGPGLSDINLNAAVIDQRITFLQVLLSQSRSHGMLSFAINSIVVHHLRATVLMSLKDKQYIKGRKTFDHWMVRVAGLQHSSCKIVHEFLVGQSIC